MTTCVYCEKNKDEIGFYKEYDCPKVRNKEYDDAWNICDRCPYHIEGGEEVPYGL